MDVGNVDKPLPSPLPPPSPGAIDSLSVPGDALSSIADIPPSPASASFATDAKQKKANPLVDLIDTEKAYVDLLAGIIRKVAAAWSRSNLPPKDLDIMFRSIEGVYKANRSLYSKLKEVGTNPSNPKALGDLLMRWIDDLNTPYTTYCTKFRCGFDTWDPVQSNPKLANILSTFSATNPPPASATASHSTDPPIWTLDDLFILPKARLKYYKKLYGRLLKSTAPGRSDYRLLVGALETLDTLMATLESRSNIFVGETDPVPPPSADPGAGENAPLEAEPPATTENIQSKAPNVVEAAGESFSREPSLPPPPPPPAETRMYKQQPTPVESRAPSPSRASASTLSMPVTHLEQRLSTKRTLDIFTMQPKTVRLQIAPPSLTFTRELRYSGDVTISFTPQATGVEVVHVLGHIFLLSDLFLVCERVAPEEMSQVDAGVDMWLCYPPLSGKVLRVSDIPEKPNAFRVAIMRKEHLTIETSSIEVRHKVMSQFKECIDFAASLPPPSKQAPPPVPPLNVNAIAGMMPGNDRPPRGAPPPGGQTTGRHMSMSPPSTRSPSPRSQPSSIHHGSVDPPPVHGLPGLPFSPEAVLQPGAQRTLSPQNTIMAGPPRATSTVPQVSNGMPPIRPGQGLPANPRDPRDPRGSLSPPPPGAGYPPGAGPNMGPPRILSPGPPRPASGFSQQSHQGGPPNMMHSPPGQAPFPPNIHGQGGPPNMMHGPPPGQAPFPPPNNHMMQQQHPFPTRPNQPGMPGPPGPHGGIGVPPRPPSEPGRLPSRSSISNRSLGSQYSDGYQGQAPPIPPFPGGHPPPNGQIFRGIPRSSSFGSLQAPRPVLPSENVARSSSIEPSFDDPSPPTSPVMETPKHIGPITSTISATMKCKVFLQQQHAQWKSLGSAKLKLYRQTPTNVKQLVVEADDKNHSVLISTIVLTDGVERVGKTGVAIELSDNGQRTGIVYMIQLRNEKSAGGLFDSLLEGSDRGTVL